VDARRLKREVQEEAFRKGLLPYVLGEMPFAGGGRCQGRADSLSSLSDAGAAQPG
jgi:hypothetical protein